MQQHEGNKARTIWRNCCAKPIYILCRMHLKCDDTVSIIHYIILKAPSYHSFWVPNGVGHGLWGEEQRSHSHRDTD